MPYDPKKLKEKVLPKAGSQLQGKVTEIKNGTIGEFVKPEVLAKWDNADPSDPAILVTCEFSDGSTLHRSLTVPADEFVHPRSNLAKWQKAYGGFPAVGQEIYVTADAEGFYQFAA